MQSWLHCRPHLQRVRQLKQQQKQMILRLWRPWRGLQQPLPSCLQCQASSASWRNRRGVGTSRVGTAYPLLSMAARYGIPVVLPGVGVLACDDKGTWLLYRFFLSSGLHRGVKRHFSCNINILKAIHVQCYHDSLATHMWPGGGRQAHYQPPGVMTRYLHLRTHSYVPSLLPSCMQVSLRGSQPGMC